MVGKLCGSNRGNRAQLVYNGKSSGRKRDMSYIYISIYIYIYIYIIWGEFVGAACYARGVDGREALRGQQGEPCSACV